LSKINATLSKSHLSDRVKTAAASFLFGVTTQRVGVTEKVDVEVTVAEGKVVTATDITEAAAVTT
jgi:hypothetical protein